MPARTLLALDRGQLTLGGIATASHYFARTEPDGTIILEPVTADEARLYTEPSIISLVGENRSNPARLTTRNRA